ncbi:MAG: STAS domain-containing protein [Streptosporangiaceae bacterium]|jgi:anti-sigma B factor antagonist
MTAVEAGTTPGLSVLRRPGLTIAMLKGDLDLATVPALRERLFDLLGLGVRLVIVDLSGVSFCDTSGLAMLIGMQRRARLRHITVRLAAPRPLVTELLRTTGLDRRFTICATLSSALPAEAA